jgi:hypothetical protein
LAQVAYKTTDFIKFGAPLQVLLWVWATVLLGIGDSGNKNVVFAATGVGVAVLAAAVVVRILNWKSTDGNNAVRCEQKDELSFSLVVVFFCCGFGHGLVWSRMLFLFVFWYFSTWFFTPS